MPHYPVLGGGLPNGFEPQFSSSSISSVSASATLVLQLANDGSETLISHGSGCFWRHNGVVYLLTARHVLTGRSPFDDSILSEAGYIPKRIRVHPMMLLENGSYIRASTEIELPEVGGYLEDPKFDELRTDIAAVACFTDPQKKCFCINDSNEIFENVFTHVAMECAIVDYPTQRFGNLMMPVWRRGAIASEPMLPVDGRPMFLVDAATSPGFSGSPVFRWHVGPLPQQQPDGSITINQDRVLTMTLVGIYAGRLQHPHYGGEIPFVFYANRIPELFKALTDTAPE